MYLQIVLPLFLLLPLDSTGQTAVPLFASCSGGQKCEGTAICRFNICLPPQNPVPVYAHGNKTFTLQPSAVRVSPIGSPTATQRPSQMIKNYIVKAPTAGATLTISISCQPKCTGNAKCVQGTCRCTSGVLYSVALGCTSQPGSRPMMAVPVASARLIPQVLPGYKCEPGAECTGGSVCNVGICTCPPELIQQGAVCVSPSVLGLPHRGLPGYQ